jgi:hypothetical protein
MVVPLIDLSFGIHPTYQNLSNLSRKVQKSTGILQVGGAEDWRALRPLCL